MGVSFNSKNFMLSSSEAVPTKLNTHIHKYYEFLMFEKGDASYIIGSSIYKLNPGDITVTKPNVMHTISFSSDALYKRTFIQLSPRLLTRIPRSLIDHLLDKRDGEYDVITNEAARKRHLHNYFRRGTSLLEDLCDQNIFFAELLFQKFAVCINEVLKTLPGTVYTKVENPAIRSMKEYLDQNYRKDFSLEKMAADFYVSKYHICHLFKEETGITVNDYLALRRISGVRELVRENVTISDAFKQCGFNDYSNFYRTVKKYTGEKPSDFYGE